MFFAQIEGFEPPTLVLEANVLPTELNLRVPQVGLGPTRTFRFIRF